MQTFVDEASIEVSSGNGGSGAVSFRREKYVPKGGPDGGDGGRGGDVTFLVKRNLKTLAHLKMKQYYKARNGENGRGRRKHGKDGDGVVIYVPPGTMIRDLETGQLLNDLIDEGSSWVILKGGKGGQGNWHFKTSTNQTPRYAQPGIPGQTMRLAVELDLIADIGLVGLPNAGKSTLLSVFTNADPKIGSYPFTTKIPNLGVMRLKGEDVVIADIPGIIEGASEGAGLGIRFLKHISRTAFLAFLIDLSDPDLLKIYPLLKTELKKFSEELYLKKSVLVGTKLDLPGAEDNLEKLKKAFPEEKIFGISSISNRNVTEVMKTFLELSKKEG